MRGLLTSAIAGTAFLQGIGLGLLSGTALAYACRNRRHEAAEERERPPRARRQGAAKPKAGGGGKAGEATAG